MTPYYVNYIVRRILVLTKIPLEYKICTIIIMVLRTFLRNDNIVVVRYILIYLRKLRIILVAQ